MQSGGPRRRDIEAAVKGNCWLVAEVTSSHDPPATHAVQPEVVKMFVLAFRLITTVSAKHTFSLLYTNKNWSILGQSNQISLGKLPKGE